MRATVRLSFGPDEVVASLPAAEAPWSLDDARRWLDQQFTSRECEPLRVSGKVLTVDKLLAVADAVGAEGFRRDDELRRGYAQAATTLLARERVHVDVPGRRVAY